MSKNIKLTNSQNVFNDIAQMFIKFKCSNYEPIQHINFIKDNINYIFDININCRYIRVE